LHFSSRENDHIQDMSSALIQTVFHKASENSLAFQEPFSKMMMMRENFNVIT